MHPSRSTTVDSATLAVEDRWCRALAVLRVVVLVNAIGLNLWARGDIERPALAVAVLLGMSAWTGFAIWAYRAAMRRTPLLLGADLAVAVLALLSTPVVKDAAFSSTVPGFWVVGSLMAWAVCWRLPGGLVAGVLLSVVDLFAREEITRVNYGNVFLLLIGGSLVGWTVASVERLTRERDQAERAAAAAAERARLARAVHDGVLQVLALVQRRGPELGPEGAELSRLAGDQERSLRSLIRQQDMVPSSGPGPRRGGASATGDLARELEQLAHRGSPRIELVTPGQSVSLPAPVVDQLVAAVSACLDNVQVHVGDDADAWVLLEALPDSVMVSVRDEGPGIPVGRLAEAATDGRLGVCQSIRGRLAELGGSAELHTSDAGTEWELTVPR